jgi:hypothetical protein
VVSFFGALTERNRFAGLASKHADSHTEPEFYCLCQRKTSKHSDNIYAKTHGDNIYAKTHGDSREHLSNNSDSHGYTETYSDHETRSNQYSGGEHYRG